MPVTIIPKAPQAVQAFQLSATAPDDLWELADLCTEMGYTLNARFYRDPSPSVTDGTILSVTIRPNVGATPQNTITLESGDWLTWDGINMVVQPDHQVHASYVVSDAPEPSAPLESFPVTETAPEDLPPVVDTTLTPES